MVTDVTGSPGVPVMAPGTTAVRIGDGRPESSTHVQVATFDGPLALLLSLIEARQLDVLTVPLGGLADAYLEALAGLEADRLGNISAFVAVASQLILIKSRAMLPRPPAIEPGSLDGDDAPDPEAELRKRLILYRAHRDAGLRLAEGALERIGVFRREPGAARAAGMAGARPADAPPIDPARLAAALAHLALIAPPPEPHAGGHAAHDHPDRARRDHPGCPAGRTGDRPPGPARRRARPGGRRGDVPRAPRAHEATRDRGRAGRAVGSDRGPGDRRRHGRLAARRVPGVLRMTDELDLEQGVADGLEPGEGLASPEEGLAPSDDRPPLELTETALEALLFVAERPLSRREIASLAGVDRDTVDQRLGDLEVTLAERGIRLIVDGDRVELATAPEAGALVARYVGVDAIRLSPASLETLAIVAYRQPVTRAAIERIRGVDSDYTVRSLLHRRLIVELGRADAPGRPFLYGTGFDFLERFGLTSLTELPPVDVDVAARLAEEGGEAVTESMFPDDDPAEA